MTKSTSLFVGALAFGAGVLVLSSQRASAVTDAVYPANPAAVNVTDGKGTLIGRLLSADDTTLTILTPHGYVGILDKNGVQQPPVSRVYYSSANCAGTAYLIPYNATLYAKRTYSDPATSGGYLVASTSLSSASGSTTPYQSAWQPPTGTAAGHCVNGAGTIGAVATTVATQYVTATKISFGEAALPATIQMPLSFQ
jgi:hypothetical protein